MEIPDISRSLGEIIGLKVKLYMVSIIIEINYYIKMVKISERLQTFTCKFSVKMFKL